MRTRFLAAFFAMALPVSVGLLSASCADKTSGTNEFRTDSISYVKKDTLAECNITVDAPVMGDGQLGDVLKEFISEELGGSYKGGYANMDSLLAWYGNEQYDAMSKMAAEVPGTSALPYSYYADIRKVYETDKLVTYTTVISIFTGGAHPMTFTSGTTFRKSDGRRFGMEIFNSKFTEKYTEIVYDGLKKYFDVKTDEELKACLLNSVASSYIPLPQNAPYFTKDGIMLVYGQYEIAPYAAGTPTVVIPYDRAKELLKVSALEMTE